MYFYFLLAGNFMRMKKMFLLRIPGGKTIEKEKKID
jgi:hypothetical protein